MRGLWTHLERLGARHRHPRPGRVADRDRPPPGPRPHRRAQAPARPTSRARARRCAPSASARTCPQIALAGYTNAGKSTLLNALTGAEVGVRDRLFHTLDPTTRSLRDRRPPLPADRHRRLHPQAAPPARRRVRRHARGDAPRRPRRSTSSTRARRRRSCSRCCGAVEDVLEEIGAGEQPAPARAQQGRRARRRAPRASSASAIPDARARLARATGEGLDELRERIEDEFARTLRAIELLLPYAEGGPPRRAARRSPATSSARTRAEGVRVARACRPPSAERFAASTARERRRADARGSSRLRRRAPSLPRRAHAGDAGLDLYALEAADARARASARCVRTGIAIELPPGHAGLVLPRSGLAVAPRHRARQRPRPDRRGLPRRAAGPAAEHRPRASRSPSTPGDRIAQLVLVEVATPEVVEVDELAESARGERRLRLVGALTGRPAPRGRCVT